MRDRLLIRHFLQRFLENDLISPDADRHEVLSVVTAALITCGLFGTILLSLKYLFVPFQPPGWTAIISLDDTFIYTAYSMIVMSLVALAEWDALGLDARDAAILGPLPVPRAALVRAKLAALAMFAAAFAIALNLLPAIMHPLLLTAKLAASFAAVALLVAAHATATASAGLFGFASVFGLRELLRAALGPVWFQKASTAVQAALVVLCATAFLLAWIPTASRHANRSLILQT